MGYPGFDEIVGLARQVRDLAVKRKAEELDWCKKGVYQDRISSETTCRRA